MEQVELESYIPFYKESPTKTINLDELETLCFKRVACLKLIELESEAGEEFEKIHERLLKKLEKQDVNLKLYIGRKEDKKVIENDEISHFMLRLAYCRTDDYKRWLITQETRLFRHILFAHTQKNQIILKKLLIEKNIKYEDVKDTEWEELGHKIAFDKINPSDKRSIDKLKEDLINATTKEDKESIESSIKKLNTQYDDLRKQYFKFDLLAGLAIVKVRR
jgi:hypothetical protein